MFFHRSTCPSSVPGALLPNTNLSISPTWSPYCWNSLLGSSAAGPALRAMWTSSSTQRFFFSNSLLFRESPTAFLPGPASRCAGTIQESSSMFSSLPCPVGLGWWLQARSPNANARSMSWHSGPDLTRCFRGNHLAKLFSGHFESTRSFDSTATCKLCSLKKGHGFACTAGFCQPSSLEQ